MPLFNPEKPITTLLIDLDETVYPTSNGLWPIFRQRMDYYLEKVMGFAPDIIPDLRERLFNTYGTTLRGLQVEYSVDMADFLDFVHDIPLERYLEPDPALIDALQALPQAKYIFTNAHSKHARRVLGMMGLSDLFTGIIDIYDIYPSCKPFPESYHVAMQIVGESDPARILMVEDRLVNLEAAFEMGMHGVLVSSEPQDGIPTIHTLSEIRAMLEAE